MKYNKILNNINNTMNNQLNEIQAYHGSPADFDKFDVEYLGTGEGGQAHGWGLYFSLNPNVAERYNTNLARKNYYKYNDKIYKQGSLAYLILKYIYEYKDLDAQRKIKNILNSKEFKEKYPKINDNIIEKIVNGIKKIKKDDIKEEGGQIFKVEIPDLDYFLDEQKPLSQQSDYVKKIIEKLRQEYEFPKPKVIEFSQNEKEEAQKLWNKLIDRFNNYGKNMERFRPKVEIKDDTYIITYFPTFNYNELYTDTSNTGEDIYERLSNIENSRQIASKILDDNGIKGIKYDGRIDGKCVVVFNADNVKILKKYFEQPKSAIPYDSSDEEYIDNFIYNFDIDKPIQYNENSQGKIESITGYIALDELLSYGYDSNKRDSISDSSLKSILTGESWIDTYDFEHNFDWEKDFDDFDSFLARNNIPLTMSDIYGMYEGNYLDDLPIKLQKDLSQIIENYDSDYETSVWSAYGDCYRSGIEAEAYKDCIEQITDWYSFFTGQMEWSNNTPSYLKLEAKFDLDTIKDYMKKLEDDEDSYENFWEYWNEKEHDYVDEKLSIQEPYYGWNDFDNEMWTNYSYQAAQKVINIYNEFMNKSKQINNQNNMKNNDEKNVAN